jgi:hypothetical protein
MCKREDIHHIVAQPIAVRKPVKEKRVELLPGDQQDKK